MTRLSPDSHSQAPFVGRKAAIEQLLQAFRSAEQHQGTSVLVRGEPGIGKSTLLQRFATLAGERGRVLVAHGRSEPGAPALWPWIELLRELLRLHTPLQRDTSSVLQAFSPWLPRDALQPALDRATPVPGPQASQFMLGDTLVQLVFDAAQNATVCLILEDLHDFDEFSLVLVRRLLHELPARRLLVVASCRTGKALEAQKPAWVELLAAFAHSCPLAGLDLPEVLELMELGLSRPVSPELASSVHSNGEGNPLYVRAVVATLGALDMYDDASFDLHALRLPASVSLAGRGQLDAVSGACRRALRQAALFGREFDLALLRRCAGAEPELEELLASACERGLLQRLPTREKRYRFTHVLLREMLEQELDADERAQAHERVARALAPDDDPLDARSCCSAARHWLEVPGAEALERAAGLAARAAREAGERGAHSEAADALRIVVAARRKRPPLSRTRSTQLELAAGLIDLGRALFRAGKLSQAFTHHAEAAGIGHALGEQQLFAEAVLAMADESVRVVRREELALCELACGSCTQVPNATRVQLLAAVGAELCLTDRRAQGLELVAEAERLAANCDDAAAHATLLRARHTALPNSASLSERRTAVEQRLRFAEERGCVQDAAASHSMLVQLAMEAGDPVAVRAHFHAFTSLAPRAGDLWVWFTRVQACTQALLSGRFAEAGVLAEEARQLGAEVPNALFAYLAQSFALRRVQGNAEEHIALLERASSDFDRPSDLRATLASCYCEYGRLAEGRVEFTRALAQGVDSIFTLCQLAEAARELGEAEAGVMLHERLSALTDRCALATAGVVFQGAVAHYAGLAALAFGNEVQAVAHFTNALAINRRMGALPALARTQFELARVLASRGELEAARKHFGEALQVFEGLRMVRWVARARALAPEFSPKDSAQVESPPRPATTGQRFERNGDHWQVSYRGRTVQLRDLKGMKYLAELLARPDRPVHVLELTTAADAAQPAAGAVGADPAVTVGPLEGHEAELDATSIAQYRARMRELEAELADAQTMRDLARAQRFGGELEFLRSELISGARAHHRPTERARKAVYNRIRQAIEHIDRHHAELGRHLTVAVKTGVHCMYCPEGSELWTTSAT